jgi:hypothetical protein
MPERQPPPDPSLDDKPLLRSGNPNPLPAGEVFIADPNSWYRLKANYINDKGKTVTGYANPRGENAAKGGWFWDYVIFSPSSNGALRFKLSQDKQGWSRWEIHDDAANSGYHLDCKATGWLYRASAYNTGFRVVDNKLYCNYWDGPVGSRHHRWGSLDEDHDYLGMDLPVFTCVLEKVS